MVGDGRLVDAHALRDLRVRVTCVETRAHEPCEVERREPVALLVLGDLRVRIVRSDIDDDRHLAQARELGSTKPLRTESNTIPAFGPESVDHDGLKNTVQRDVGRQLAQFVRGGPRNLNTAMSGNSAL